MPDQFIVLDGTTYRVLGVGTSDEEGRRSVRVIPAASTCDVPVLRPVLTLKDLRKIDALVNEIEGLRQAEKSNKTYSATAMVAGVSIPIPRELIAEALSERLDTARSALRAFGVEPDPAPKMAEKKAGKPFRPDRFYIVSYKDNPHRKRIAITRDIEDDATVADIQTRSALSDAEAMLRFYIGTSDRDAGQAPWLGGINVVRSGDDSVVVNDGLYDGDGKTVAEFFGPDAEEMANLFASHYSARGGDSGRR